MRWTDYIRWLAAWLARRWSLGRRNRAERDRFGVGEADANPEGQGGGLGQKKKFRELAVGYAGFSGIQIVAWCLMDNHFYLLVKGKRQSWHLRIALVPPMDLGLSARGEVRAVSGIFA